MSLDKVTIKLGIVNVLMSRKKFDAALAELSEIVDHFIKDDSCLQDAQVVDILTNSCITRININFDKKPSEAEVQLNRRSLDAEFDKLKVFSEEIDNVKENINVHFDTYKMFLRTNKTMMKKRKP
ncbi:unnamed protein product [Rotaria magnacalcarata]